MKILWLLDPLHDACQAEPFEAIKLLRQLAKDSNKKSRDYELISNIQTNT